MFQIKISRELIADRMGNSPSSNIIPGEVEVEVDNKGNQFEFKTKSGYLYKKGMGKFYRPWKRRRLVLEIDYSLSYYGNQKYSYFTFTFPYFCIIDF